MDTWKSVLEIHEGTFTLENPCLKKSSRFFGFGLKSFWGLNQKSAMISICEIQIYNLKVSDKLIEKCEGVG